MKIGVDLGGTKIEAICLDTQGNELQRRRVATPAGDYVATLQAVTDLVLGIESELGVSQLPVGIGTPGTVSRQSGLMKNCNSTCLNQQALQQDLEAMLARPLRIANDANCFALSEAVDGAAAGASVVFGVIIGTGVGGGLVVERSVLNGANGISGEWGHNPMPAAGLNSHDAFRTDPRKCYCGRVDCVETYLSGPGLSRSFTQLTNLQLPASEICQLAEQGDRQAATVLELYCQQFAAGIAQVINIVDPDVVVLGGGLSQMARLYSRVAELWSQWVFSDQVDTRLLAPVHGDSGGVRGAAWLW